MIGGSTDFSEIGPSEDSTIPPDSNMILNQSNLLPGDVLLYRPIKPNLIQCQISVATGNSPYTHAAIYLGEGLIAGSNLPKGVAKHALKESMKGTRCVAVLRSQLGVSGDRPHQLNKFVEAVINEGNFYNLIAVITSQMRSKKYFDGQLNFIRENYAKVTSKEDFAEMSFFLLRLRRRLLFCRRPHRLQRAGRFSAQ